MQLLGRPEASGGAAAVAGRAAGQRAQSQVTGSAATGASAPAAACKHMYYTCLSLE